jgi:hypothetical protein
MPIRGVVLLRIRVAILLLYSTSINERSNPVTLYVDEIVGKEMTDETLEDTVIKRSKS